MLKYTMNQVFTQEEVHMQTQDKFFELKFSELLESEEYERAEAALFEVVRAAFEAGWKAAGGTVPSRESTEN